MSWNLVVGSTRLCAAADYILNTSHAHPARLEDLLRYAHGDDAERCAPTRSYSRLELAAAIDLLHRLGMLDESVAPGPAR